MAGTIAEGLALAAAALVAGAVLRSRRVVVSGTSMLPTLRPGDRLVVVGTRRVRRGDIVAVTDPRQPKRVLVKRVDDVDATTRTVTVAGDNPTVSTDSRTFGRVPFEQLVGRAVYRYAPKERAGRLSRGSSRPGVNDRVRSPGMPSTALDDLLAPGFLVGLASLPIGEIRVRRAQVTEVEVELSYVRRLVQGRLDIVLAEVRRREVGDEPGDLSSLVRALPEILGDRVHSPGSGRLLSLLVPVQVDSGHLDRLDAIVDADRLVSLPELSADQLDSVVDDLVAFEREVSSTRRGLHEVIDRLQEELVRRYKTGEATVDGLLR